MQYFQSRFLADDPLPRSRQQRSCWRRERGAVLEGTEARSTPPSRRSAEKSESTLNHCCVSSLGILADRQLESTRIRNPLNPQTSWAIYDVRMEVPGNTRRALKERRAKIWSRAPVPQLFSTTVEQTRAPLSQPNTLEIAVQCKHEEYRMLRCLLRSAERKQQSRGWQSTRVQGVLVSRVQQGPAAVPDPDDCGRSVARRLF
jgi:hypothetical protein